MRLLLLPFRDAVHEQAHRRRDVRFLLVITIELFSVSVTTAVEQ